MLRCKKFWQFDVVLGLIEFWRGASALHLAGAPTLVEPIGATLASRHLKAMEVLVHFQLDDVGHLGAPSFLNNFLSHTTNDKRNVKIWCR